MSFLWLTVAISATIVPLAVLMVSDVWFSWWLAAAYLVLLIGGFYLPMLIMVHLVAHRPLFRPRYAFLRHYLNWVLHPLFGLFPNAFFAHHIAMHHAENNSAVDLSSTLHYQRDSLFDFVRYAVSFPIHVYFHLPVYLWRRKRFRLVRAVVGGQLAYVTVVAGVAWFHWQAALVVFGIPLVFAMAGFSCTNWTEHAFVDEAAPQNIYRSAIVCINTIYNRVGFNDGYHVGHHLKPNLHWSELAEDFRANWVQYASEDAIVFRGLDYYRVWFLLMTKQYRALARRCVDLADRGRSEEETIALLRRRAARFAGNGGIESATAVRG